MAAEEFIGRVSELEHLNGWFGQVREGRAGTVMVSGEAGVGKSRLLEEFVKKARDDSGVHVLRGACIELGNGVIPYAPLVESLRMLVRELGEKHVRGVAGPAWNNLSELISDFTGAAPVTRQDVGPGQIFGAVMRLLEHLGKTAPVLLVFEDMHWADQSTLDLVSFLTRNMTGERALLVCSHRSELPAGHALRVLLAEPDVSRRIKRVRVPRFTEDELRTFLDELASLDRDAVRRCYGLSNGNAFFAEQLVVSGALTASGAGRIPESVNELMLVRIGQLSDAARQVMRVAAAAARRVDDELLAAVCGLDEDALVQALHECRDRGMLVEDPVDGFYVVRHALLSGAIYEQMVSRERRRLHTEMARTLVANAERGLVQDWSVAVELAHHWDRAQHFPEALATAVRAGEMTRRVRAFHEAEGQYRRALQLWERVSDPESAAGRTREEILVELADAARWAGHVDQAVDRVQEAIDAAGPQADARRLGELYERLGSYLWEARAMAKGHDAYVEAERLLKEAAPRAAAYARAMAGLAMAEVRSGSYTVALDRAKQAVTLANDAGDVGAEGRALNAAGLALAMLGEARESELLLRQALTIADHTDHLEDLLRAYGNLALALELAGNLAGAVEQAREGLARAKALGLVGTPQAGLLANNASVSLMLLGRWNEATDLLNEVLADRPRVEQSAYLRLTLAEIEVARGRFDEAERLIEEARRPRITDPRFVSALHVCEAELWCWLDRPAVALAAVYRGLDLVADAENSLVRLRLSAVGLRAAADCQNKRPDEAVASGCEQLFARAERDAATQASAREAEVLRQLCEAEYHRAVKSDSASRWAAVAAAWAEVGRPYQAAYARWRQAAAVTGTEESTALAREVAEAASRLGAEPLRSKAAALLEQLKTTSRESGAVAGAGLDTASDGDNHKLSRREQEVLALAANGLTNQEIAKRLVLANGTVASHMNRIMKKLGVGNRTEAAVWAHRNGLQDGEGK